MVVPLAEIRKPGSGASFPFFSKFVCQAPTLYSWRTVREIPAELGPLDCKQQKPTESNLSKEVIQGFRGHSKPNSRIAAWP